MDGTGKLRFESSDPELGSSEGSGGEPARRRHPVATPRASTQLRGRRRHRRRPPSPRRQGDRPTGRLRPHLQDTKLDRRLHPRSHRQHDTRDATGTCRASRPHGGRAAAFLDTALAEKREWVTKLGAPPRQARVAQAWRSAVRTIAAYRDRYGITDTVPLGSLTGAEAQKIDAARAKAALDRARGWSQNRGPTSQRSGPRPAAGRTL